MRETPSVRPLPLKIAAIIGVLATAFYLAVAVGAGGETGAAFFWATLMGVASLLAWFADQLPGRRSAIAAAILFFVLGLLAPLYLALAFLVAVILCVVGIGWFERRGVSS